MSKRPEELTEQELRRLLLEKRRQARQRRLERFRRSGRVILLAPDLPPEAAQEWPLLEPLPAPETSSLPEVPASRRWMDRILLAVEVLAVIGLIGILAQALGLLQMLNKEVADALRQPTLTPTPLITAIVLPGGHTPPSAEGGAQFNEEEIPVHLRPLVQSLVNLPAPTPAPQQAIRIQIPAIGVDAPIVQGDSWEQLKKGVGQHLGSGNPGQPGNVVLSAHNDIFGEIFRDLDRLKPGDLILLFTAQQQYAYVVTRSAIVEPTAVEVMAPTPYPSVTLISCYPYRVNTKRIVVFGQLKSP